MFQNLQSQGHKEPVSIYKLFNGFQKDVVQVAVCNVLGLPRASDNQTHENDF